MTKLITCPGCGAQINPETGEARALPELDPRGGAPEPLGENDAERADRLERELATLRAELENARRQAGADPHEPPNARRGRRLFNRGE